MKGQQSVFALSYPYTPVVPELCIIKAGSSSISWYVLPKGYGRVEFSSISSSDGSCRISKLGHRLLISKAFCFRSAVYTNFEQSVALRR